MPSNFNVHLGRIGGAFGAAVEFRVCAKPNDISQFTADVVREVGVYTFVMLLATFSSRIDRPSIPYTLP